MKSNSAFPPVSFPSAYSVSCDRWKLLCAADASWPEKAPTPPGDGRVASPSGAPATRPRASTGKNETLALSAAFVVARNCAWLSTPFSRSPLAK